MKVKIFVLIFMTIFTSCTENSKSTIIKGHVPNLPDGILYLYKDIYSKRIDSVYTKKGRFVLKHKWTASEAEPFVYLGIDHIDSKGNLRAFTFLTNAKFKGSGYNSQLFLSDSVISISGMVNEFNPKGLKTSGQVKIVVLPKVIAGYQTNALFNIDGDLFNNIDKYTYEKIESKIKEYPNSFHLLYQINNNRNSFTVSQIQKFLSFFKGDIVESENYKKLKDYNKKRFDKKKIELPFLTNGKNEKMEILDKNYKMHLVVFWASWCGPCRQEIPELKKMYIKYEKNIEFVSISIDAKKTAWQKALAQENMPWKQLIVDEESLDYETIEIFFQLSNSIPYMVLLDEKMKVLRSTVGLMTQNELEKFIAN